MKPPKKLLIVGAGGFGCAVAEAAALSGVHAVVGFADDRWPVLSATGGFPVLGRTDALAALRPLADTAIVAIGNNTRRQALSEALLGAGFALANVVHPWACVSPSARLGQGVTVMAGAIVGCEAALGDGVIGNAGCVIDHHCVLGAFSHVGIGARLAGGASLGVRAWMQEGCCLEPEGQLPADTTLARPTMARG